MFQPSWVIIWTFIWRRGKELISCLLSHQSEMFHSVRFHGEQSHVVCHVLERYWLSPSVVTQLCFGQLEWYSVVSLPLFHDNHHPLSTFPRTSNHLPTLLPPHPHLSDQNPFSLGALLSVVGQPWWKGSLRKNGYMYMYAWVPLLFAWNNHNFVNQLYSNIKLKRFFLLFFFFFKEKLFASCISRSKPSSMKDLPLQALSGVWCHYNQRNPIYVL